MKLRDGRKIWITFQVCEVNGPIMSVGKCCTKGNDRCATFTTRGGVLLHEEAGEIVVDRVRNHYELECWIKPGDVLAPVQTGGCSGSAVEPAGTSFDRPTTNKCRDPDGCTAPGSVCTKSGRRTHRTRDPPGGVATRATTTQQGRDRETQSV